MQNIQILDMLFILNDCLFSFMFCFFVNERSKLLQESVSFSINFSESSPYFK